MTSSSSSAGATPAGASSTLSPNAVPFTLTGRRPGFPPPGGRLDGDASSSTDDSFVMNGGDKKSRLVLSGTYFGMNSCSAVYPAPTHGTHKSQPSPSHGIHVNVYPSSTSTSASGIVSESSVLTSDFKQQKISLTSGKGSNGSKRTSVTIKCPPNKSSETDNVSFGSVSKLAVRENDKCNKETGKDSSLSRNIECSNPADGNCTSQGTLIFPKELNPFSCVKPLHIPPRCASSCVSVADDVNPDPSECSVDSPCWPGVTPRLFSFDVLQTSAARSIEQSSSIVEHCEALTELNNLVTSKGKEDHSEHQVELGLSEKPGETDRKLTKDSYGKGLELTKHDAEKCKAEQKHCLEVRDNCTKRSGLNSAAPVYIPSSVRKSNRNGSCSSSGRNISGILKGIESMSEVLWSNYSDEIELEQHDHNLLQSIIENLQSYINKARKGSVKGASDKAGLKAVHSQNAVSKSDATSCDDNADNGKDIIISNLADSSRLLSDFGKNSLTGYQPTLNNSSKEFSCEEEHPHVLVFKNLWIDAERANCALKYQLKQTRMEIDLESSMAHNIGGGLRSHSFQLCDMGAGSSNHYGSATACAPVLRDNPGARKSQNLLCGGDCIHSGGSSSVLSRSKGYITVPKNMQGEHFLSGLEEIGIRCHAHPSLQLVPNWALRGLNPTTSDGMSSLSYVTGRDGDMRGSSEFGFSDWEHVLKEEIA